MKTKVTSLMRTSLRARLADLNARIEAMEIQREGDVDATAMLHQLTRERNEISDALDRAVVIDDAPFDAGAIEIGDTVTIRDTDGRTERFVLVDNGVGARPEPDWVSVASPLGGALLGSNKGEEVSVETPAGRTSYVVLAFERALDAGTAPLPLT